MLDKILIYSIIIITLSLMIGFSYDSFKKAFNEWELSKDLIQDGIPTQAIVQSCISRRGNCNTTYQYEVPSSDQQMKTYTVREYGCNCEKGQQVTILYLPDDPSHARLYYPKHFNLLRFGMLFMIWSIDFIIIFFFPGFLAKRVKMIIN